MKKYRFKQFVLKQQKKIKRTGLLLSILIANLTMFPLSVFAEENAITSSSIFKGLMKMLTDGGVALLIIAPIVCGLLFGIFSLIQGMSTESHDKEKWGKNKKTVLIVLAFVFSSSAIVAIIAGYFK